MRDLGLTTINTGVRLPGSAQGRVGVTSSLAPAGRMPTEGETPMFNLHNTKLSCHVTHQKHLKSGHIKSQSLSVLKNRKTSCHFLSPRYVPGTVLGTCLTSSPLWCKSLCGRHHHLCVTDKERKTNYSSQGGIIWGALRGRAGLLSLCSNSKSMLPSPTPYCLFFVRYLVESFLTPQKKFF